MMISRLCARLIARAFFAKPVLRDLADLDGGRDSIVSFMALMLLLEARSWFSI